MVRTRSKRRLSKEFDPPNMSGEPARENSEGETERREDEEEEEGPEGKRQRREKSEDETERREDEEELERLRRENEKLKMRNEKLKMENEKLKREQEEKLKREEEEKLKREEAEKLKREQAERLKREQVERLRREQEKLKREQVERLRREQEKLKREQAERLKREQEEKLKREQEGRLKREQEGRLKSARELEMKKIQEFVQRFPDQQKETESAVEELKNIAAYIRNDRDALVDGTPATSLIRGGAAIGVAGVAAGAVLGLLAGGGGLAVCAAAAGAGAAIASKGASALKDYNKEIEKIRENASSRMTEIGRSAATAIVAVLNLKRLSGSPDTAADPDHEKLFEMLKTDSGLRDLTERMEELLGAAGTDKLADSEIDKIAESVFPNDLNGLLSLFTIILSFNIQEQKNEKASKICECAEKLEENLQAVTVIHTAMKPLDNFKPSSVSATFVVKEEV